MAIHSGRRSLSRLALAVCCITMLLLAGVPTRAQRLPAVRVDSGLMTFYGTPKSSVRATVTELGPAGAESRVRIVFYGAADEVLAVNEAVLRRGKPVRLELPLDDAGRRVQLRMSVILFGASSDSSPAFVLESLNGLDFTVEQRISCAPPSGRDSPVLPFCPEVVVSDITIGQ